MYDNYSILMIFENYSADFYDFYRRFSIDITTHIIHYNEFDIIFTIHILSKQKQLNNKLSILHKKKLY